MTIESLERLYRAQPFRPFTVHLADGREVAVEHPGFLARTPGGRTIIVTQADESFEVIDRLLVTSLSVRNGQARGS